MQKEEFYGNIEYKRHLLDITQDKIISYSSQIKYRLKEGNHICYYYIGLNDNGSVYGLVEDTNKTINNFNLIVKMANAYIDDYIIIDNSFIKFKIMDIKYIPEYRITIEGNKHSGKKTFINNILYNINGYKKLLLNEINIINYYTIGINKQILNYSNCEDISQIKINSEKLIYFINIKKKDKVLINSINPIYRLIFILDKNEIFETDPRIIYMLRNDDIDDYKIENNICEYNNNQYNKLHNFILNLNYYDIYDRLNNSLIIINVLYSFSLKKYLLIVLSNIDNGYKYTKLNLITCDETISGSIDSIYLNDIKEDYIKYNNTTYTIIIEFEKNVNKLKNKIILLETEK